MSGTVGLAALDDLGRGNKQRRQRGQAVWRADKNVWQLSSKERKFLLSLFHLILLFLVIQFKGSDEWLSLYLVQTTAGGVSSLPKQTGLSVGVTTSISKLRLSTKPESLRQDNYITRRQILTELFHDLSVLLSCKRVYECQCVRLQGGSSWKREEREKAKHPPHTHTTATCPSTVTRTKYT